jgi:flagellar protein FlaJ
VKDSKTIEKIRAWHHKLKERFVLFSLKTKSITVHGLKENLKLATEKPHSLAYRLVGEKTVCALPLFRDLDSNLQRSESKISFKAYVSLTVLASILLSFTASIIVPCILFFALHMPLSSAVLFGVGGGLFTWAITTIGFYVYPLYRADKLKRELEDELPFTTGYMAILASAGVSPERIFYSVSNVTVPLAISGEAGDIVRNLTLFGADIISALEQTSKRTPSERLRETLEGLISTIHSGGNLAAYLREQSGRYMKLKRISLRKFSDTLSILSEFYVAILVTGPLLLVVMLAVMAMLGGGELGGLSPSLLLQILTYIGIPVGSIIFLIILDAVSPRW